MIKQYKIDEVKSLAEKLKAKGNIIFTDYSGVKVKGLQELRKKLRAKNVEYKVVKNNLFKLALKEAGYEGMDSHVKGPVAVAFIKSEVAETAKIFKDFSKEQEKFSFSLAVFDKVIYNDEQVKKIAELPSKDVIISQVMSLINGPSRGIAVGINQIMASLARGIKAVAESNSK
jgi:large subunit ribosomal protein L10